MTGNGSRARQFIQNALLLTGTSLIIRFLAMAFNVWLSAAVGAEGIGLYTLVLSVYGLAVTFAASGINLAAARLTAESLGRGESPRSVMKLCLGYAAVFGTLAFFLLTVSADFIGHTLLDDERTVGSLRALAVSLPFLSTASALNGYFQAVRQIGRNALSQLVGQGGRMAVTAFFLTVWRRRGLTAACFALSVGGTAGELLSFAIVALSYGWDGRRRKRILPPSSAPIPAGRLFAVALPVAVSSYVRSALSCTEHILIPRGLEQYGAGDAAALATYGVIHGMVFPVLLFPQAFLSAVAGLLVTEIAQSAAAGETRRIRRMTERVYRVTLAFSVGITALMIGFAHEIGTGIYHNDEAAAYLRLFAPLIPLMYLDHVTDGILKGMNEQVYVMRVNLADSLISVILVWRLLPLFGIRGYVITVFVSELVNTALSIGRLLTVSELHPRLFRWFAAPLICAAGAVCLSHLTAPVLIRMIPAVSWAAELLLAGGLYLVLLRMTATVTRADVRWFLRTAGGSGRHKTT